MANFWWTFVYVVVGFWILSRVVAYVIQWLLKRYLDVTLRFGKVGFFNFGKVQMTLHRHVSVHVELEKIWLSSSFFNPDVRKPVVLCIEDMRIQVDVSHNEETHRGLQRDVQDHGQRQSVARIVNKIMLLGSYGGLRVHNVTVMLLKTMVPDCLIHFSSPEISLDITAAYDRYELCVNLNNFGCKALRSSADAEESMGQQNCLAEFSFAFKLDAKVDKADPVKLVDLKTVIAKPQMMITEGFLQNLQMIDHRRLSLVDVTMETIQPAATFAADPEAEFGQRYEHWPNDTMFSKLKLFEKLQIVSFDISDLDVKIVRETKQRSLAVSLKLFHMGFHNHSFLQATDVNWNIYMEEFSTSSMQANFAGVSKVGAKGQLLRDSVDLFLTVTSGFFHYHHEEVQYWLSVFSNIFRLHRRTTRERPRRPLRLKRTKSVPSPTLLSWMAGRNFSTVVEVTDLSSTVSSAACTGLHAQLTQAKVHATLKPGSGAAAEGAEWFSSYNASCEVDIQSVGCWLVDAKPTGELPSGRKHYWGQILYLGILLMKVKKFGTDLKVEGMKDNIQLEWSSALHNALTLLLSTLRKTWPLPAAGSQMGHSGSAQSSAEDAVPPRLLEERRAFHTVKFDVSNINVFVTNSVGASVMLRVDSVAVQHSPSQSILTVDGTKVQYIICDKQYFPLKRSTDIPEPVAHVHQIKVKYSPANKECRVHILQNLNVRWTPEVHLCLISGLQDARALHTRIMVPEAEATGTSPPGQGPSPSSDPPASSKSSVSINILMLADISFEAKLSRQHTLSVYTQNLLVTMTLPDILMEVKDFNIKCDGHSIFSITGFQLETLPASVLKSERAQAKILEDQTNKAWGVSFESIDIVFPYQYNFAACYEEVMNAVKWLKLVHKVKKKAFTVDSPLPPDLNIKVKMLSIELSDDPFEVKMGLNYELLKDEGIESKKRKEVMDAKLLDLQKKQFIPVNKREELFASLHKRNSEIYIQRSQQLYNAAPIRTQLFTWLMEDLTITALADRSFHGTENVLKNMRDIDSESPFPKEPINFITLWCRYVSASVKLWSVSLRDFPRPMVDIQAMHVWGRLVGAEREGTARAKRTCTVEVDEPWTTMAVERNLPSLKFFHDFSCDMSSLTLAYGVCWEPAVALYNLSMDRINKPSVDPSRPLPFWDKMRLLFHGRFTASISCMSWLYHASLDPYNNTELMDWTWTKLLLDWTNAQFVLQGDLDISVRTASKYNESKLLHLPNLTFRVCLEWLCLGDANDHHPVMPCAPDKVPDFSLEEHDSFRAFRSQNLNLDLSLKTRPVADNLLDIPSCPELYASTLRFLEKIKNCMFSVTRPVRRGKLFGVITPRRLQLTRHYKKIKLSVDFHKFAICHWMSNAKENGAELISDSFVLQMCNRLNLVPLEDGLLHRPRADWSIKYLKCQLGPTRIYLCKNMGKDEAGATPEPADRSFFLSVTKISYQRSDRKSKSGKKEDENGLRVPTHSVSIHEMKGAWNQFNRTVVIGLYDSYMRAKALRRNLSSEALKGFRVDSTPNVVNRSFSLSSPDIQSESGEDPGGEAVSPSPLSKLQMGHAHSMLLKLVSESDSKSVAFTEEPSDSNVEQLHGIRACKLTDILQTNWHIELHNSQVVVRGCEAPGYVIVSAARAKITSYTHMPIWRQGQLRSKSTWNGDVDCMQYYATVDPNNSYDRDNIPWLSRENVEDRANADLTGLPEMIGSGQSVGSVVSSAVTGVAPSAEQPSPGDTVQLQRIIYRCSCKFFYANYGDVDPNNLPEVPLPPAEDADVMSREEGVDTFTLLHESVYAYSNPLQFSVIMDIVNNLLLYVEPKKKAASDRLQSMRFKLQLYREDDQKTPILQLQEVVRERLQELRQLEKEYYIAKTRDDEESMNLLEVEMEDLKNWIGLKNEELGMRISCYNESQLQVKAQMKMEKAQQAQVVRRNEVCFKYAKWRMTERDGHCGIAELELRNFVYSKVNRDDDSWTHQLELNWVKVENLLTDNFYQKVLVPKDPTGQDGENRQMALRITCTERPPVGGIPVKEHFEVNVAPIQIQMTYQFYKAVMEFFFPDKNMDMDDEDEMDVKQKKEKKNSKKEKDKRRDKAEDVERSSLRSAGASFSSADDINKMRERAAKNNTFLYIKIPEVIARVSYKGQKEKNIEDVHDFSFLLPTVEFHNRIWTWFDLLITLKNHSKRVLLSQAIKQKLHWKARVLEEAPHTDVQEEEDKAKMLLGAKLLAGQEKPAKKGFFTKSHKS
ncbi:protein KIAA0100 isoform X2 [Aplysia californica]|uniref:Protein KIAA0100 isoform X2 n=1 Tax=Aplysia californica TaxID=6500 RepID=A0ABM0JKZ9_APLCA|nr:protein KIAA0100 isoform X2 [Aplysia californica]